MKKQEDDLMRAVDTNIFLYHVVSDSKFGKRASEIIEQIEKGEEVFVPLAVLKELLFLLLKRGKTISYLIDFFANLNKENVQIAEDDFELFLAGLKMANEYEFSPADGVILSVMQQYGVTEIYSNDPDFDKVPGIKRIF